MGSVFDDNRNGERDSDGDYNWWTKKNGDGGVAVPTHFYAVVVKCNSGSGLTDLSECDSEQLTALGLILQHTDKVVSQNAQVIKF